MLNRRSFLKALSGIVAAFSLPKMAKASPRKPVELPKGISVMQGCNSRAAAVSIDTYLFTAGMDFGGKDHSVTTIYGHGPNGERHIIEQRFT